MLENINSKIEGLTSSIKNQLSFNKIKETQIAQIAASIPVNHLGKSQGNPRIPLKNSTWLRTIRGRKVLLNGL
jgi:hypothetical protein